MDIEIYARWEGQTADERGRQDEGWLSAGDGTVGYLSEACDGEPYATRYFVAEAFGEPEGVPIPAAVLRERLPVTLQLAERRERTVYHASGREDIEYVLGTYRAFVEFCERIENETGRPVTIVAST